MLRRHSAIILFSSLIFFCYSIQATSISTVGQSKPATKKGVIVAFGDSLTAGLGVPADQAYPALLKEKLHEEGYHYRVVNAGVSGETTAGGLRRVDWVLKRMRPDIVILELGANDGLRGLDLGQMEKNLAAIIERFQENDVTIVLAGMKIPPNYGQDYTGKFEKTYQNLADRYNLAFIPFFLEGVAAKPLLNQADGLHPTAKGYRILVDHVWPILEQVLKSRFP
ncbi:arylesterase [Nitrospira defluvii]|nr:arylesterase [Nitrospira defluvii]